MKNQLRIVVAGFLLSVGASGTSHRSADQNLSPVVTESRWDKALEATRIALMGQDLWDRLKD